MRKSVAMLFAALALLASATARPTSAGAAVPNPVLYLTGQEPYVAGGERFIRYHYDVFNKSDFPAELFAAAPGLPPCGSNMNSSRTWVDVYDQRGRRLNGFCALNKAADLDQIWFSIKQGELPPSWIYIEMTDRQTSAKYRSNLAETSS